MYAEPGRTTSVAPRLGFSGRRTAELVGCSYRQLDYWARTNLIRPSITDACGSGSRRQYSYDDLLDLALVRSLTDAGVALERVRSLFERLDAGWADDTSAVVVLGQRTAGVVTIADLLDVVAGEPLPVIVVAVAAVCAQVEAAIALR